MKLFMKKYLSVIVLSVIFYSLLFIFKINDVCYFNYSFVITILFCLLIRLFDDFIDYKKDEVNNRVVFNKPVINILNIIFFVFLVIIIVISKNYLFLIPLSLLVLNLYDNKIIKYSKSLYLPMIVLSICFHYFGFSVLNIILMIVLFIGDLILIYRKR